MVPLPSKIGFSMSKTSTPSILPNNSNLSKPVAWSKSVGIVPGLAPGPIKDESGPVTSDNLKADLDSTLVDWAKILLVVNNLDCLAVRTSVRESLNVSKSC